MLILSRRIGEEVVIDGRIRVMVLRASAKSVQLGFAAPDDVPVHRKEVHERIRQTEATNLLCRPEQTVTFGG